MYRLAVSASDKHWKCLSTLFVLAMIDLITASNVTDTSVRSDWLDVLFNSKQHHSLLEKMNIESNFYETLIPSIEEQITSPFRSMSTIEQINGIPAAFGDFNSDHFTDVFLLTEGGFSLEALKAQSCVDGQSITTYFGSRTCLKPWNNFKCNFDSRVHNVVGSDFTGRMMLDLLITTKQPESLYYEILLVNGQLEFSTFDCSNRTLLIKEALTEPFVIDYNGDMITDFVVQTPECQFLVWFGHSNTTIISDNDDTYLQCMTNITNQLFANPHSNAFLNLNEFKKDMTPDLYINGQNRIEYIFNTGKEGFSKSQTYSYPQVAYRGQSSFLDINYDGQMEHIIPACIEEKSSECTKHGILALDSNGFWNNLLFDDDIDSLGKNFNRYLTFAKVTNLAGYLNIPITLRIADINYDGYPDLAAVLQDVNDNRLMAGIFINQEEKENKFSRVFKLSWLSDDLCLLNVVLVNFFDIYNNGRLNLMITTEEKSSATSTFEILTYDYYAEKSNYYSFLRVNVISGLCSDKLDTDQCPQKEKLALGTNPPGTNACFEGPYTGEHSCSAQLSQSAHFALQLPFMVFGLGDTLNVINDLRVSIANGNSSDRYNTWDENIPGSNLIVVPFRINSPDDWDLRVYINMSSYWLFTLGFLLGIGLILIIAIYVLHFLEKKEDRKEQKEYKKHWL